MKAYLALGYCPSQRSGGFYETTVLEVELEDPNLLSEWFNASLVFLEAFNWLKKKEEFFFPSGKNPAFEWSEEQWQLFLDKDKAEEKAQKWANNDLTDEMASAYILGVAS